MLKRFLLFSITIFTICVILNSCATSGTNNTTIESYEPIGYTHIEKPEWITEYPIDDNYFIGIGSSNTGKKQSDMEAAKKNAIVALSSDVASNIEAYNAELFDSWYSEEDGYWFYYRISKAKIDKKDSSNVISRVKDVVDPIIKNPDSTVADIISTLAKGWEIVSDSPHRNSIKDSSDNTLYNLLFEISPSVKKNALALEMLESVILDYLSSLSIGDVYSASIVTESGKVENLTINVTTDKEAKLPGIFQIDFYRGKADGEKIEINYVTTNIYGSFSGNVDFSALPSENDLLVAVTSQFSLYIEDERLAKKVSQVLPKKNFYITQNKIVPENKIVPQNKIATVLDLTVVGSVNAESFEDSVKDFLYREEFALILLNETGKEDFTIDFTANFIDLPKNSYGLYITNVKATLSLVKDNSLVFSYETKESREVGLSLELAQKRATIKLLQDINKDVVFIKEFHEAIYPEATIE